MNKICERDYRGNGMLTLKMIGGVAHCPACGQPAICHHKSVDQRALFWALFGSTGTSSKSLAQHMTNGISDGQPPSDGDDRSRCIRLLQLIPEWIPRLKEMVKYDERRQETGIVINSSGISADHNKWEAQIPLIIKEGELYATSNSTTPKTNNI